MTVSRTPSERQRATGRRLRQFRKDQGLSAMDVAVRLGCTQQNYEFYELGRNTISSDRLREFASALRCDVHHLLDILYPGDLDGDPGESSKENRRPLSSGLPNIGSDNAKSDYFLYPASRRAVAYRPAYPSV